MATRTRQAAGGIVARLTDARLKAHGLPTSHELRADVERAVSRELLERVDFDRTDTADARARVANEPFVDEATRRRIDQVRERLVSDGVPVRIERVDFSRAARQPKHGSGGFGDVVVYDTDDGTMRVAVKVFRKSDADSVASFERELVALSVLSSPSFPTLLDYGVLEDGRRWIAMSYAGDFAMNAVLLGEELSRALDSRERIDLVRRCAYALAELHAAGLVHLDFKPQNVVLQRRDGWHPVILDFGYAEPAGSDYGQARGTPTYLDPAVLTPGLVTTPTIDVYGLARVATEIVWLRARFPETSFAKRVRASQTATDDDNRQWLADNLPDDLGVDDPAALIELLVEMLRVEPGERPSAAAVGDRLSEVLGVPAKRRDNPGGLLPFARLVVFGELAVSELVRLFSKG